MTRYMTFSLAVGVAFACGSSGVAMANAELLSMQQNPKEWVMPTGNYANTRFSELDQINASNVQDLRVSRTFSTGVLRGHEGGPLDHLESVERRDHPVMVADDVIGRPCRGAVPSRTCVGP